MAKVVRDAVVVFGGATGMVGSNICIEGRKRGFKMIALARSRKPLPTIVPLVGTKSDAGGEIVLGKADAFEPSTYEDLLKGAKAVVIAVGAPPLPDFMYDGGKQASIKANGMSNLAMIDAAKRAGVPKVVVVGASMPAWVATGYETGKTIAEASTEKYAADGKGSSVLLKPGFVIGTRYVFDAQLPVPLWLAGAPVRALMDTFKTQMAWLSDTVPYLFKGLLLPPVTAQEMATATMISVEDERGNGKFTTLDPHGIIAKSSGEALRNLVNQTSA